MHENVFMIIFEVISYNYIHFPRVCSKYKGNTCQNSRRSKVLSQWFFLKKTFPMVLSQLVLSNCYFFSGISQWYFLLALSQWYFPIGTLPMVLSQ